MRELKSKRHEGSNENGCGRVPVVRVVLKEVLMTVAFHGPLIAVACLGMADPAGNYGVWGRGTGC